MQKNKFEPAGNEFIKFLHKGPFLYHNLLCEIIKKAWREIKSEREIERKIG